MDLAFAVDGSRNVDKNTFSKMKKFIKGALTVYTISNEKTHIGIAGFGGDKTNIVMPLSDGISVSLIENAVGSLERTGGPRRMNKAIRYIGSEMFTSKGGSRPDAEKVLVLLTAGKNSNDGKDDLPKAARQLKDKGIEVFVIAIGKDFGDEEIKAIASNPDNVAKVESAAELPQVLDQLEKTTGKKLGR